MNDEGLMSELPEKAQAEQSATVVQRALERYRHKTFAVESLTVDGLEGNARSAAIEYFGSENVMLTPYKAFDRTEWNAGRKSLIGVEASITVLCLDEWDFDPAKLDLG